MENKREIQKLYENYVSQNIAVTEEYKQTSKEFANKIEKFEKNLKAKDISLIQELEEILNLINKMNEEQAKKSFEAGYSMGVNLTFEAINNGKLK